MVLVAMVEMGLASYWKAPEFPSESLFVSATEAAAAFTPFSGGEAENHWPTIATGNWGCGAFGGYTPLKALQCVDPTAEQGMLAQSQRL